MTALLTALLIGYLLVGFACAVAERVLVPDSVPIAIAWWLLGWPFIDWIRSKRRSR